LILIFSDKLWNKHLRQSPAKTNFETLYPILQMMLIYGTVKIRKKNKGTHFAFFFKKG
jgi:hypothetical protein